MSARKSTLATMFGRRTGIVLAGMLTAGAALVADASPGAPSPSSRAGNGHVDVVTEQAAPDNPDKPDGSKPPDKDTKVKPKAEILADSEFPADGETDAVGASGDAADDMAFWPHPTDPARSVVIGTDKEGALEVYGMDGKRIQAVDPTSRPGNVDWRGGFTLAGKTVDVVGVVGYGMRFYVIDPDTGRLTNVTAEGIKAGLPVAGNCMYRSPVSGKHYMFADTLDGRAAQYELFDDNGKINVKLVRGPWSIGSEAEACTFDDENQWLYVAEEVVGIWRYGAEPDAGTEERTMVSPVGRYLAADVEGLAVVRRPGGGGYLLASSQGDDAFVVYQRNEPWEFVRKFTVPAGPATDRCSRTDGIDAVAGNFGPLYPRGVFACQDHVNDAPGTTGNQNFKLIRLEKILELE